MKQLGCTRVAVADDKTPYGVGLATQIQLNQKTYGITVTGVTPLDPTSPNFRSYASTVKSQGANCVYTAFDPPGEVELVKDINAAVPTAKIFGGDGVCSGGETNPKMGGFPASIAPLFHCTVATQGLTTYPGGKAFLAAYKAAYGVSSPDPYSIYGYEDMQLGPAHDREAGRPGQQQIRRGRRAVRDPELPRRDRHLRVRQKRRHDAEVVRPVQGWPGRQPPVR